jgi:hypothetical protein
MTWAPYQGDSYLNYTEVESFCHQVISKYPNWISLDEIGQSQNGISIYILSIGDHSNDVHSKPAIWIDGGTHSAEWTGIMATLYIVSKWLDGLSNNDTELIEWFRSATAYVLPCISPDGFTAMMNNAPFLRSSLRLPQTDTNRIGFEACDMNDDNKVEWMRWQHPAGPFVPDEEVPIMMRPRTLDDDPANAYFFCSEGKFINWDGVKWVSAPLKYGLDLNRNFPAEWAPFNMFGMDGGDFALSEPESDAVVRAFAKRPFICAALTNHTYAGCILTQPYRKDSKFNDNDIALMHSLSKQLVSDTNYKTYKVFPDFTYKANQPITGLWSETISTVFGIPGYVIEYWNPFDYVGEEGQNPIEFFMSPDPKVVRRVLAKFIEKHPDIVRPWQTFKHPQLGNVEIGGFDYMRSIRNPPLSELKQECETGLTITNRLRKSIPSIKCSYEIINRGNKLFQIDALLENYGFLPTSGLKYGENIRSTPQVNLKLNLPKHLKLITGSQEQTLSHIHGWGNAISEEGLRKHPLYPGLSKHGHRATAQWFIEGEGTFTLSWIAGRAGKGECQITLQI